MGLGFSKLHFPITRPVGAAIVDIANSAGSPGLVPGPVKADAMPPRARNRCEVSS